MGDSRDPSRIRVPFSGQKIQIPGTDIELPMGLDLSRRDVLKIAGYGSLAAFMPSLARPRLLPAKKNCCPF